MCYYMGAFYNADSRPMPRFQRAYPRIRPLLLMELRSRETRKARQCCASIGNHNRSQASVDDGRKKDIPEIWGWRGKFDRYQRPFRTILWRTRDLGFDRFLGGDIFDGNFRALRKSFCQNNQCAGGADSMSRAFNGLGLASNFQANGNTQQHALRAAAFFRSERPS